MEEEGEKDGGLGGLPPPENILRTTTSRMSEHALLIHSVKVTIIIHLCAQKEN